MLENNNNNNSYRYLLSTVNFLGSTLTFLEVFGMSSPDLQLNGLGSKSVHKSINNNLK